MNLGKIDLNLLVAFDTLMAERSVTRAAQRLALTQPAMSNALKRLRGLLDDPVLVRAGAEMVPTDRAIELAIPVHNALMSLEQALSPSGFDSSAVRGVFHIATADLIEIALMPRLLERLQLCGPFVDLRVYSLPRGLPIDEMKNAHFDLAVGSFGDLPPDFMSETLMQERFVSIVRADHPIGRQRLTLKRFAELDHVVVAPLGQPGSVADRVLADHGLTRRVVVTTPHWLVAPMLVLKSDMICTIAEGVAQTLAPYLPLRILKPPIEMPGFELEMVWHRRADEDPAQCWLRDQVRESHIGPRIHTPP